MSSVIAHEHGYDDSCHILLGFDTINLLAVSTFVLVGNIEKYACNPIIFHQQIILFICNHLPCAGYPDFLGDSCQEACPDWLEGEGQ